MTNYHVQNLINAVERDDIDTVKEYLDEGYSPNSQDDENNTLLHYAAQTGSVEMLELLISYGANPNKKGEFSETPLMLAIRSNRDKASLYLIKYTDLNIQEEDKNTALMYAVDKREPELVKKLLENKANPDIKNSDGNTALILAVGLGEIDIVNLLIEYKSNTTIQNNASETALTVASKKAADFDYPYKEITEILVNHELEKQNAINRKNTIRQQKQNRTSLRKYINNRRRPQR